MSAITVTLIQTDLQWENKKANLLALADKIMSVKEKTEIIVLPEMFSTGFSMQAQAYAEEMDDTTINWMRDIAITKRIILTGSIIIKEKNNYYNRLIWMLPDGNYGYYDKRHLFAYAGEDKYYTAGSKRLIASAKGWKINLQVCYDLRFPVWSRQQLNQNNNNPEPEYDLLIYVANWPQKRNLAWKTLLQARAIENQAYVIGVNRVGNDGNNIYYSGDSLVIDPLGSILYHKTDAEDVHTITLYSEDLIAARQRFPFWKDADTFTITNTYNDL